MPKSVHDLVFGILKEAVHKFWGCLCLENVLCNNIIQLLPFLVMNSEYVEIGWSC